MKTKLYRIRMLKKISKKVLLFLSFAALLTSIINCNGKKKSGSFVRPSVITDAPQTTDPNSNQNPPSEETPPQSSNGDSTPLNPPIISVPISNPYSSNDLNLSVSGVCISGATVYVTGDSTSSVACTNASFSMTISKPADGTYNFSFFQKSNDQNASSTVSLQWVRDTLPPSAPTITSPGSSPYTSADSSFVLSGACENGVAVNLTGDQTETATCSSSSYAFTISKSVDGTYNYSVSQTDSFGNASSATDFQWIRNSNLPPTPSISSPAISTTYSNGNNFTIAGSCVGSNTVNLSGSSTSSVTCSSSAFSFTVNKVTDGTYTFSVVQVDSGSSLSSGSATVQWVRDTDLPAAPSITSSSSFRTNGNSVTITGTCETNSSVEISGASTASLNCPSGTFSTTVSSSSDGTYNYSLHVHDLAGNQSASSASVSWIRDTVNPSAPTITTPNSSTVTNGSSSLVISGACESGATVHLDGASTSTTSCSSSSYSFSVNKVTDGTYSFTVSQTDLASNNSSSNGVTWIRDTTAPSAPTISSPSQNPYTSADTTYDISGSCETGSTVNLTGSNTDSDTCAGGSYAVTVNKSSDGTYNYSLSQTDSSGNTSSATTFQWVRDSAVPATPALSSPASTPYYSNGSSLVLSGSCTDTFTVELTGSDTQSATCSSSTYSFTVNKGTDGTYNFTIKQKNGSNLYSAAASLQWIRDTVAPSNLTVNSGTTTNTNSVTISGVCETNATVNLSGAATQTYSCASGTYSFSVSKSTDTTYNFLVSQTDLSSNISSSLSFAWVRDTVVPAAPTFSSPSSNPYISGAAPVNLQGVCESGSTVTLKEYTSSSLTTETGTPSSVACSVSNTFTFTITKSSTNATYYFGVTQKDVAQNSSSAAAFEWTVNMSLLDTPSISYNSSSITAPIRTNTNSITLSVTCTVGASVLIYISGDVSVSDVSPGMSQTCSSSPVSFTITKTSDATYTLNFYQDDSLAGSYSGTSTAQWIRDATAPSAPTITTPSSSPFTAPGTLTLAGTCETSATVNLSGDATDSATCSSGTFQFSVSESVDGTYNYSVTQTDITSNTSSASTIQWIRDSNSVPPPSISLPVATTFRNNESTVTISGSCNSGYLLTLAGTASGDVTTPSGSLTQTCTSGSFTYVVNKSSVEGTFNLTLKQTFNAVDSSLVAINWTRDVTLPTTTISTFPSGSNLQATATFVFAADETSTFQCKLDTNSYSPCTSPMVYSSLANGSHTFYVKATDLANNTETEKTKTWTQASYKTMALYSLDSVTSGTTSDESGYTVSAGYNNNLTMVSTPTQVTGKFSNGYTMASGKYFSNTTHNASQNILTTALTIEGFFKPPASWTTSAYTLVSKNGGASGSYGWELRITKSGGNSTNNARCNLTLMMTSANTTVPTSYNSTTFKCAGGSANWQYFAVTWDAAASGSIKFYASDSTNSTTLSQVGTATFGSTSTVMATNAADLKIGSGSGTDFIGGLDEIRISQVARSITAVPSAVFTAD